MNILQFNPVNLSDEELEILPDFCKWICLQMATYLNSRLNIKKIQIRLKCIYDAPWIEWKTQEYIGSTDIMKCMMQSITYRIDRYNVCKIYTDALEYIPNSYTSIDRLIRFLNFGDRYNRGTGMITKLQEHFQHKYLNTLWRIYILHSLGTGITDVKIIAI